MTKQLFVLIMVLGSCNTAYKAKRIDYQTSRNKVENALGLPIWCNTSNDFCYYKVRVGLFFRRDTCYVKYDNGRVTKIFVGRSRSPNQL